MSFINIVFFLSLIVGICSAYTPFVPYPCPGNTPCTASGALPEFPGLGNQGFAAGISGDGNWAVLGAPFYPIDQEIAVIVTIAGESFLPGVRGLALVYEKTSTSNNEEHWNLVQVINATNEVLCPGSPDTGTNFGFSVAINQDGSYIAISADKDSQGGCRNGAVYVYQRSSTTTQTSAWNSGSNSASSNPYKLQQKLIPCFPGSPDQPFPSVQQNYAGSAGYTVAIDDDGDVLAVGAPTSYEGTGSVVVFYRSSSTWVQDPLTPIIPCNLQPSEFLTTGTVNSSCTTLLAGPGFGGALDINADGTILVIGASSENGIFNASLESIAATGATFVYQSYPSTTYQQNNQWTNQNSGWNNYGNNINNNNNINYENGDLIVPIQNFGYNFAAVPWLQIAKVIGQPTNFDQAQGASVAVNCDGSIFATYGPASILTEGPTMVYVFQRNNYGQYTQLQAITVAPTTQFNANSGTGGVDLDEDGDVLVAGVPCNTVAGENNSPCTSPGQVNVYQRASTNVKFPSSPNQIITDRDTDGSSDQGVQTQLDNSGLHVLFSGPSNNAGQGTGYIWKRTSE